MNGLTHDALIHTDLHVHLYGCLTPLDVWELGRDRWQGRIERLEAWASRLDRCTGTRPAWTDYWRDEDGAQALADDFLCTRAMRFEEFEARFGLAIALFPISPERDDLRVLRRVMESHRLEGRRHVEYRYVYPPAMASRSSWLANYTIKDHLDGLCRLMGEFEAESGGSFEPRLALSISREPSEAMVQYEKIKSWQSATSPGLNRFLTAIDFSGYEEAWDFAHVMALAPVCERLHADNRENPRDALALLIHAGETMETISASQGVDRVMAAVRLGAHRVGHAVALGFAPESRRHVATETSCVIESCITSNMVVAGVADATRHPVRQFVADGMRVCLATDDPGIFSTDARREYALAESIIGREACERIVAASATYRSAVLAGRDE